MKSSFETYAPIAISILALIVAALSLWISRLNYRRAVLAEKPIASVTLRAIDQLGWYRIEVKVENRSPMGQIWSEIEFHRPRAARGLPEANAYETYEKKVDVNSPRKLMSPLPLIRAAKRLPVNITMNRFGEDPTFVISNIKAAEGDTHRRSFFVFVPPSQRSRKLSIRISLLSVSPIEQKTVIDVHRTLPHAKSAATV